MGSGAGGGVVVVFLAGFGGGIFNMSEKKKKNDKKPVLSTNYPPDLPQFFKNCMFIKLHLVKKKSIDFSFKILDSTAQRNQLRLPSGG